MKALSIFASLLIVGGCAARVVTLEVPMDVVAVVSKPKYTGWFIDHCASAETTDASSCLSVGGDIYKAVLRDVRTTDGRKVASTLIIGFPAHALRPDFRAKKRLHLVKASTGLKADTGIEYIASSWE